MAHPQSREPQSMSAPIRVAVIGGAFARTGIAPAYGRNERYRVVEVLSSRDASAVAQLCARKDIDLVSIHAAPHQHREIVDRALDAGHHVVCDKPFSATIADAEHLAARAASHPGLALVTFEFRYQPWRDAVRTLLATGALGRLESVDWVEHHGSWRDRADGWQLDRALGGGWLGAMVAHILDTIRWWAGDLVVLTASHDGDPGERGAAERACELVLSTQDGRARASVVARGASSITSGPRVLIVGERAALQFDGSLVLHGLPWPDDVPRPADEPAFPQLLDRWCAGVADAITSGVVDPALATFADGLAWARLREQFYAAARVHMGSAN
jgi:predicted dehydrogenase